ncbi:hypothetical protein GH714_042334 [Hevea brasiliensis]|uniref:Uncharacterized protein n=1 Tax=Hevea brasiliensis TaxID=3981 RepID=A0A6A6K920_HEVBR|nr:hypothetical protein GH714_042334 [Hevea brasiliensis]
MAPSSKLHIAMFPWLAFGHMIPYLELAKLIAQKGHKVSFISTPRNIDHLPRLHPNFVPLITFVRLPLPWVDGLPENAEATSDVPYDTVQYLKKAYDGLAFQMLFSIFLGSTLSIAKPHSAIDDRKKPEDFTVPPKWVSFPTKVTFRLYEILRVFDFVTGNTSDVSDMDRLQEVIRSCEMVVVRSCMEFEPEWLQLLEDIHGKPFIPVGMLPTTEYDNDEQIDTWSQSNSG